MAEQTVFQDREELERLAVQRRLLAPIEEPLLQRLTAGKTGLRLLELGCSDGARMAERFDRLPVARAVGLEYCAGLVDQARERYGGKGWSFHTFDLDAPDPLPRLKALMDREGVAAFDLIDASFVLSHLKRPKSLLLALREVLSPGGTLAVIEADDAGSALAPDPEGLLPGFFSLLAQDPFAGDRGFVRALPGLLARCGYRDVSRSWTAVSATGDQPERKRDILHVFFSYLPQDLTLLPRDRETTVAGLAWLDRHFADLRAAILAPDSTISMGIGAVTYSAKEGLS